MKVRNISNMRKISVLSKIKTDIYFHYLRFVVKKKLSFKNFILLNKRTNTLLKSFKINKFYKIGKKIKIDHSVPLFGTSSFYNFMDKFLNFENKLSCSSALISITKDCSFNCKHCYQKFDTGEEISGDNLIGVTKELIKNGVTNFTIEGGDPFIKFDRLLAVCSEIGHKGEITINSTGNGITLEKLKKLKQCCNLYSITFSYNSPIEEEVNFFMGQDYAWNTIKHGLKLASIASIPISLNCCLHSGHYDNGNFEYLMETAKKLSVCHVKLIHPKPSGAWLQGNFPEFTNEEIDHIKQLVKKYNRNRKFSKHPAITAQVIEEDSDHYGCRAGGSDLLYVNAKGDVQPCEFLNISFGNVLEEDFTTIFNRMRAEFNTPGTTWLCEAYSDKIYSDFKENNDVLPITKIQSEKLYSKWSRGDATPLYYRIEKELKD